MYLNTNMLTFKAATINIFILTMDPLTNCIWEVLIIMTQLMVSHDLILQFPLTPLSLLASFSFYGFMTRNFNVLIQLYPSASIPEAGNGQ